MPLNSLQTALIAGKIFLAFVNAIKEIEYSLNCVYKDIATAHFDSAKQAFIASELGNSELEKRSAISHLRDAFNIYHSLLNRKIRKESWFGLFSEEVLEISYCGHRATIYGETCTIAIIISRTYTELGEHINATEWVKIARNDLEQYLDCWETSWIRNPSGLKFIDPDYVCQEYMRGAFYDMPAPEVDCITDKGIAYLKKEKENTRQAFDSLVRYQSVHIRSSLKKVLFYLCLSLSVIFGIVATQTQFTGIYPVTDWFLNTLEDCRHKVQHIIYPLFR